MSGPKKKRCEGGGHDGQLLTTALDEQQCLREGGEPGPWPDAGANRISTALTATYLTEPVWQAGLVPGGLTNLDTAERLLLFPICQVHRRLPASELVNGLDALNERFGEEVGRIATEDPALGAQVVQLLIDISSLAGSALESETSEPTTFTLSKEFLDSAEQLAVELAGRSTDERLASELERLVALARQVEGTRLSDLLAVLDGQESPSDRHQSNGFPTGDTS
jgi:hypothetical protein